MAYRQGSPLGKIIVIVVVGWLAYTYGLPWVKEQGLSGKTSTSSTATPNADCVAAADDAVAVWSNGIVRYMNPPIDADSWSAFRAEVERKIDKTRSACGCQSESCTLSREIVSDLGRMLSEMDSAARSGGAPPGDLVRAQESIDLKIEQAWKLADAGK